MKKTLFIAHRGYSRFEKENTLVAFSAAGAITDFYGIETDVHITNDGHYITIHDETTNRVCFDKVKINVEENPFSLVKHVKLPDVDGSETRYDIRIPEMVDYFKICKKYQKVAVCELKQSFDDNQIKEILQIVHSVDMLANTIFISFDINNLIKIRQINKSIKLQYLLCEFKAEVIDICKQHSLDVDVYYKQMTKENIQLCHENHMEVNVWTVDDIKDAKELVANGVDYITSNHIYKL